MASPDQGYTTSDTKGRRATVFQHRLGSGATGPAARKNEAAVTSQDTYNRPCLARKKAICDFRVRWPDLLVLEKQEEQPLTAHSSSEKVYDISTCSSAISISYTDLESKSSEGLDSREGLFAVGPGAPPPESLALTIINSYLNPESMTGREKRVRKKTIEAMSQLQQDMEAAKSRHSELVRDVKEAQKVKSYVEDKCFLEYLQEKKEDEDRKYASLWNEYKKQSQGIQDRRQELASTFAADTAAIQRQLMESRMQSATLKRKQKALEPIAQVKERQDRTIRALELEEASIVPDIPFKDLETHLQFLRDRVALEKQLEELNLLESGEDITRELKKKARALKAMAKKAHEEFSQSVSVENEQLRTQFRELDRKCCKLEARRQKLEKGKQKWKEQQWYLEALTRGRQRLQQRECRTPKQHTAPHPTQGQLLGARPRANPK